jgi:hypothetical protein
MGASYHSEEAREENDFYATDPEAARWLLEMLYPKPSLVWEPACGAGHLSKVLEKSGCKVISTDLFDRGYGQSGVDFLKHEQDFEGDIITNPPYKYAQEFVEKAHEICFDRARICMFLKLTFLETKARRSLFNKYPPKAIWVSSSRIKCAKNGDFEAVKNSNAIAYAWFI